MASLTWGKGIQEAITEMSGGTRLLMLFLHRTDCESSQKMLTETFNDQKVISIMERETVPVKIDVSTREDLVKKYHVDFTPTFVFTDESGVELDRWVGFLPPDEFIAQLTLSKGLADFHLNRLKEAEREFELVIEESPQSELVPEAEYYLGITRVKEEGSNLPMGKICETLMNKYPNSIWTKRCSVWSYLVTGGPKTFVDYNQGGTLGSGAY